VKICPRRCQSLRVAPVVHGSSCPLAVLPVSFLASHRTLRTGGRADKFSPLSLVSNTGRRQIGLIWVGTEREILRTPLGDLKELLRMNVLHPAGCELGCREVRRFVVGRRLRSRRIVGEIVWAGKVLGLAAREGKITSAEVEPLRG
jgi:hypothetical protein